MQLATSSPTKRIKSAYADWFCQMKAQVAFTGSALQCIRNDNGLRDWLTLSRMEVNVSRFIERLSRDVYGRSAVRAGQSLSYVGVIEGQERPLSEGGQRLHVHLALGGIPDDLDLEEIFKRARYRWAKSNWGYYETETRNLDSDEDRERWIQYLLKKFDQNRTERWITNLTRQ